MSVRAQCPATLAAGNSESHLFGSVGYTASFVRVCTYRCVCVYTFIYIYIYMYIYICMYMYVYTYIYIHVYIYMYVYVCVYIYIYMYMYVSAYTYIYIYTYTYAHMYMYRQMCKGVAVFNCIRKHTHSYLLFLLTHSLFHVGRDRDLGGTFGDAGCVRHEAA